MRQKVEAAAAHSGIARDGRPKTRPFIRDILGISIREISPTLSSSLVLLLFYSGHANDAFFLGRTRNRAGRATLRNDNNKPCPRYQPLQSTLAPRLIITARVRARRLRSEREERRGIIVPGAKIKRVVHVRLAAAESARVCRPLIDTAADIYIE